MHGEQKRGIGLFCVLSVVLASFLVAAEPKGNVVVIANDESGGALENLTLEVYQEGQLVLSEDFNIDTKVVLARGSYTLVVTREGYLDVSLPAQIDKGVLFVTAVMQPIPVNSTLA